MHNQQLSYTVRISLTDIFDQLLNEVIYFTVSNNEAVPFLCFITSLTTFIMANSCFCIVAESMDEIIALTRTACQN